MQNEDQIHEHAAPVPPPHKHSRRYALPIAAAAVALAIGVVGGAGAMKLVRPTPEMAPVTPVAISTMPTSSLVTIKGTVAEIYGNKFILQDESGKALVETGPAGDDGDLVKANEAVTVQGRFDNGFVRASYLVRQDGKTEALGPQKGPPPHRQIADLMHKLAP
ncbi:hypothetical protein RMR16_019210 [Agrobacterium sp. rho-13.3]|uniref:hypothetical protein n=1 Tax=Agrobacterium sp. rho-13.3 TaxID=3072980 RepID=UPI002A0E9590|nr:hypothetical protein [Agrobacterium sp. rho-13.3]MDX8308446.1 hypothetical protein [Agrobacterium sp. rho-13.3]